MTVRSRILFAVFVVLLAGCASTGPSRRPNEKEWRAILARYDRIEQVRASHPRPAESASRKERIEALIELYRAIEPELESLFATVQEYYERTGDPRAALLYANEKVRIGDEYMDVLARYDRAIGMYQSALAIDPANARAQERLALAKSRRFIEPAAFAKIHEGISEEDVRELVGQPREDWIKQVIQKNRLYSVWIFARADGGAAAIYFENGVVYHTNWNAAPPPESQASEPTEEPAAPN